MKKRADIRFWAAVAAAVVLMGAGLWLAYGEEVAAQWQVAPADGSHGPVLLRGGTYYDVQLDACLDSRHKPSDSVVTVTDAENASRSFQGHFAFAWSTANQFCVARTIGVGFRLDSDGWFVFNWSVDPLVVSAQAVMKVVKRPMPLQTQQFVAIAVFGSAFVWPILAGVSGSGAKKVEEAAPAPKDPS